MIYCCLSSILKHGRAWSYSVLSSWKRPDVCRPCWGWRRTGKPYRYRVSSVSLHLATIGLWCLFPYCRQTRYQLVLHRHLSVSLFYHFWLHDCLLMLSHTCTPCVDPCQRTPRYWWRRCSYRYFWIGRKPCQVTVCVGCLPRCPGGRSCGRAALGRMWRQWTCRRPWRRCCSSRMM